MTSDHRVYVITHTILDTMSTVSVSSHPLYWWYHTKCISEITSVVIHDIISIVYDMTATVRHHKHCIHDIRFPTYDTTSRVYDISSPIPVTSQTLCLWIQVNYISHQTHGGKSIQPLYLKSQPQYVYLCDHTHCVDDITHTVFMTWHLLYGTICTLYDISPMIYDIKNLYPLHQSILSHIKLIISDSTSTVSLSSHPDYKSYNPHCIYDNTATICMTSYEYIWHHIHALRYHTTLWHHTHCIHVITPRSPVITSTVAGPILIVYWLYHTYYM